MRSLGLSGGALSCVALAMLAGCGGSSQLPMRGFGATPQSWGISAPEKSRRHFIKHVVVIIQENRSVDNLFNGFPGADTVRVGKNLRGQTVALAPISLTAPYDLSHEHSSWVRDHDRGKMNGFNTEREKCRDQGRQCPKPDAAAYGYVPRTQVEPYWTMAQQYTFADRMFQTNQGPSFPAHQYLISGTSVISNQSELKASENAGDPQGRRHQGGCDSVYDATVATIDPKGNPGPAVFPCFVRNSIMQVMNAKGVSWRYYQEFKGSGSWNAVDAIEPVREGSSYANVVWPSSRVLEDIVAGALPDVTFVTPSAAESDHAGSNNGTGPSWVASIVNAIGQSPYWNSTAIFVVWDDWGGWYDHVAPRVYNSYENGFRVPLIVISPYAKQGYVSHVGYEFGSILKFIETTFGLESLDRTDVRSHNLDDCFNFDSSPKPFEHIRAPYNALHFESLPIDYESVDDDN